MDASPTEDQFDDVRELTRLTRVRIGFDYTASWPRAPAHFDGRTLTIQGHPVMEDWETDYMRELAAIAASSGGTILEVGFGMGISAGFIQSHGIREHLIIEANQQVYERANSFAKSARVRTRPIFGMWEDITPLLPSGSMNGILFDTYPLSEAEIHRNHFRFFPEAHRLLAPGGIFTYYSDEIDDFSDAHLDALKDTGFSKIEKQICAVSPPADCLYWKSTTILAPVITR